MREFAARALGEMGPEANTAIQAITESLQDNEMSVREAAAQALGSIGSEAKTAIPDLNELLWDKNNYVQVAAKKALGKIWRRKSNVSFVLSQSFFGRAKSSHLKISLPGP